MNENTTKRRDWIKNAMIVFLTVMLILTFFSNTIMNYSLPEVAVQNATSASITAKVRGTGTIEASDPYNVEIKESRVIASVAVKQGDTVEKGDVLFMLEDAESAELLEAQTQLNTLRLEYEKAILSADSSSGLVDRVESGEITSSESKLAEIDSYNKKIERLGNSIESYNNRIAEIDAELSKLGDATVDTSGEQWAVNDAQANLDKATAGVGTAEEKLKAAQSVLESVNSGVTSAQEYAASCQTTVDEAQKKYDTLYFRFIELSQKPEADRTDTEKTELNQLDGEAGSVAAAKKALEEATEALAAAQQAVADAESTVEADRTKAQNEVNTAQTEYNNAVSHKQNCENALAEAQRNLSNKQATTPDNSRRDELNSERADLSANLAKTTTSKTEAEADLQELLAGFSKEVDLLDMLNKIKEQEEKVEKLKANATGATIVAPVSGTIANVGYVAGETTTPDQPLAQIVMTEKGFTLSFSVTADQAKKISVGDVAEVQNSWYYSDLKATVSGFKADPSNPQNRMVVFDIQGDVQAGQSLSLSVGQKSANYDVVVPNSAIREDNNGKFILIVESKSSPLGNRYFATRVDVEVLASDDTMSAVSGGLYGYESVITTSTKPVEAGKQVRLPD